MVRDCVTLNTVDECEGWMELKVGGREEADRRYGELRVTFIKFGRRIIQHYTFMPLLVQLFTPIMERLKVTVIVNCFNNFRLQCWVFC
jgi:hypothetical protein